MAVTPDAKRRAPLVEGRYMHCPRCREKQDVLRYIPMGIIEEYADETNPIYKCPICRWVFSPALKISEMLAMLGVQPDQQENGSNA